MNNFEVEPYILKSKDLLKYEILLCKNLIRHKINVDELKTKLALLEQAYKKFLTVA